MILVVFCGVGKEVFLTAGQLLRTASVRRVPQPYRKALGGPEAIHRGSLETVNSWRELAIDLRASRAREWMRLETLAGLQGALHVLAMPLNVERCKHERQRRRLAAKAKALGRRVLRDIATIVTPDTLLACHQTLIAKKYDGSARRGPGRPPIMAEIHALIVRMATDNRGWGYTRIQGAVVRQYPIGDPDG